jgi:acetyl esterase
VQTNGALKGPTLGKSIDPFNNKAMKTKLTVLTFSLIFFQSQIFSTGLIDSVVHISKVYKTVGSIELKVDIFYKESSLQKADNSAIAFFHGGGWVCGTRSDFFATSKRYASKGMIAFSFQYRFANFKELTPVECLKDAKSAIRWIRKSAKEYNIDTNKIIASGQSAGGHLAICTSLIDMYDEPGEDLNISSKPNAIIVWSACYNMTEDNWPDSLLHHRTSEILSIDPVHNIKGGLPCILAFHGTEDKTVPYWTAEQFLYEMKKAGNCMDLIRMEGKGHFFDVDSKENAGMFNDDIFAYVDEFLAKHNIIANSKATN